MRPGLKTSIPRSAFAIPLVATLAATWLYWRMFFIPPYADDFTHIANAKLYGLNPFIPGLFFFRPLEAMLNGLNYKVFTFMPEITLGVSLLGLIASTWLIHAIAQKLMNNRTDAIAALFPPLAAILYMFHPIQAATVQQLDTVSQLLSSLFFLLCYRLLLDAPNRGFWTVTGGYFALVLLLFLTKEVAFGVAFALPMVTLPGLQLHSEPAGQRKGTTFWRVVAATVLACAAYLCLRVYAGAAFQGQGGRYELHLYPARVLRNLALFVGSVAYMGNTVDWFVDRAIYHRVASSLLTAIVLLLAAIGIRRAFARERIVADRSLNGDWRWIASWAVLLAASMVPSVFSGWVSEQYSSLLVPCVALLLGYFVSLAAASLWNPAHATSTILARVALGGLLVAFLGWTSFSVHDKLAMAQALGRRSTSFLEALTAWTRSAPPAEDRALCLNGDLDWNGGVRRNYSIYVLPNYALLGGIADYIEKTDPGTSITLIRNPETPCANRARISGDVIRFD
jgi:hypothetical protein